ncbi:MAG: nucleotidyltransferase domain-containing protein [Methanothrix sp.]|nr:nucleotidyltransferase domain-containing protein [Methanothrix sp.]
MHEKIDRAVQKIKSLGGDKIKFIILYGSASVGRMKEDSDIDISVYYDDANVSEFRLKVLSELFDDVYDIKIFQQLPLPLRMQVLEARSCTQMTRPLCTTKPMRPLKSLNPSSADTTITWE